jgi:hypothetical protein
MATVSLLLNRDKLCAAENPKLVEAEGAGLAGTGKLPLPSTLQLVERHLTALCT